MRSVPDIGTIVVVSDIGDETGKIIYLGSKGVVVKHIDDCGASENDWMVKVEFTDDHGTKFSDAFWKEELELEGHTYSPDSTLGKLLKMSDDGLRQHLESHWDEEIDVVVRAVAKLRKAS